jgi:dephospho-CoA kinase
METIRRAALGAEEVRLVGYIARGTEGRPLLVEQRKALEEDGRRRIAMQIKDEEKIPFCDFLIENSGGMDEVEDRVQQILATLRAC